MVAKRTTLLANKAPTPIGKSMGEFDGSQPVRWDQTGHTLIALRSLAESTSTFDSARVQLASHQRRGRPGRKSVQCAEF